MKDRERILIYQESLPAYRLPFLNALGRDVELLVLYGGATKLKDVSPDPSEFRDFRGIELERRGSAGGLLSYHRGLKKYILDFNPDVIISEPRLGLLGVWQLAFSKLYSGKLIWWLSGHEPLEHSLRSFIRRELRKIIYRRANAFITYGMHGKSYLEEMGMKQDIFVAYNSVGSEDIRLWRKKLHGSREFQENRGRYRAPGNLSLLFIGRLIPEKNITILPGIISHLHRQFPNRRVGVVVIGDGPGLSQIKKKITELQLEDSFRILGAIYGSSELAPWFLAADALILPGKGGLAINEAVQYGLPVVTARADGTETDLIETGRNGAIIHDGSVEGFSQIIGQWLNNPTKLVEMGQASLSIAAEKANTTKMKDGFLRAISFIRKNSIQ